MKVHEAANELGVTPRALRFYEEKGMIAPAKQNDNGYRRYSPEDMERLRWIVSLREFGMSLAHIAVALEGLDKPRDFIGAIEAARSELHAMQAAAAEALRVLDDTAALWRQRGGAELPAALQAADRLRRNRGLRAAWSDRWNYDEMARHYGQQAPVAAFSSWLDVSLYKKTLDRVEQWIDSRRGEHGLELGAGSGNLTALLTRSGAAITAVEQSGEMLAILRERFPGIDARQGNLLALPVTERRFDFVACSFALQHLSRPQQLLALREMDVALAPGGRIVLAGCVTETRDSDQPLYNKLAESEVDHAPASQTPSSLPELTAHLELSGYSVVAEKLSAAIAVVYAIKPLRI